MRLIRSLLFSLVMIVATMLTAIIMLLLFFLPFRILIQIGRTYARCMVWSLKILCGVHYQVRGLEHIRSINGAAIIFSKHQSTWETYALQLLFPPHVWVLKRELMWVPFFGWGMATIRPIAIDRSSGKKALRQIVEQGKQRLDAGIWIMIFPEGTRVAPGQDRKWGIGGAILAEQTGYPVIPVAHNAGEFWPRRALLKTPGTVQVVIGPPLETRNLAAAEINQRLQAWMSRAMQEIEGGKAAQTEPATDTDRPLA